EENPNGGSVSSTIAASENESSSYAGANVTITNSNELPQVSDGESIPHEISGLQRLALFARRMLALFVDQIICLGITGFFTGPCIIVYAYMLLESPHSSFYYLYFVVLPLTILCAAFGWLFANFLYCAKLESSA